MGEDESDKDPIEESRWLPLSRVVAGSTRLHWNRCLMLATASAWLQAGERFISARDLARVTSTASASPSTALTAEASTASTMTVAEKEVFKLAKQVRKLAKTGDVVGAEAARTAFVLALQNLPDAGSSIQSKFADILLETSRWVWGCGYMLMIERKIFNFGAMTV